MTRHWHRLPVSGLWHHPVAQVVASPTLEIFKNHLGVVLVTLLCVSLLEQGLGPDDVQRCLPASAGLCLCEKASAEHKSAGQSSAWCLEELEQSSLTSPVILSQQGRRGARTACQKPTSRAPPHVEEGGRDSPWVPSLELCEEKWWLEGQLCLGREERFGRQAEKLL